MTGRFVGGHSAGDDFQSAGGRLASAHVSSIASARALAITSLLRRRGPWSGSPPWQLSFRRNWFARKNRSKARRSRFPSRRACFRIFGTSLPCFDWVLLDPTPSGGMHCTLGVIGELPLQLVLWILTDRICPRRKLRVSSNKRTRDLKSTALPPWAQTFETNDTPVNTAITTNLQPYIFMRPPCGKPSQTSPNSRARHYRSVFGLPTVSSDRSLWSVVTLS